MTLSRLRLVACASVAFGWNSAAGATSIPVTDINLEAAPGIEDATAAMIQGRLSGQPDRFTVPRLSVFQPVQISLYSLTPQKPIRLRLGKFNWDENLGGGSTGDKQPNSYTVRFRTQGDLLISVESDSADTEYALVVLAGKERPPNIGGQLTPSSGSSRPWLKWVGAGLAIAAIALVAVRLLRRRKRQS